MNPLQSATFVDTTGAVTTAVTAPCTFLNPANQQLHLHSKPLSPHFSPIFSGRRRSILLPRDRAERKRDEGNGIILFSLNGAIIKLLDARNYSHRQAIMFT